MPSIVEELLSDVIKDSPGVGELIRANEKAPPPRRRRVKPEAIAVTYQTNPPHGFPASKWSVGGLQMAMGPTEATKRKKSKSKTAQNTRFWHGLNHSVRDEFGGFEQEDFIVTALDDSQDPRATLEGEENKADKELRERIIVESCLKLFNLSELSAGIGHFITVDGRRIFIGDKTGELHSGQTTKQAFYNGGKWREDREEMHHEAAEATVEGKKPGTGAKPIAYLMGGGIASGKTTASQVLVGKSPNLVHIDPDELRLAVPEYEALKQTDPEHAFDRVHEEAKEITNLAVAKAVANKLDLLYDASSSGEGTPLLIKTLVSNGYEVHAKFVDVPVSEALRRSVDRAANSTRAADRGRLAAESDLRASHQAAASRFLALKDNPDLSSAKLYDTSGKSPQLVYEKYSGQDSVIHNRERFEKYILKSNGLHESTEGRWITVDGRRVFTGSGQMLHSGQTTKQAFYSNGKWADERSALHEEAANHFIQGAKASESRNPIAHILGGGTASGKTGAARKIIGESPDVVRVEPDEMKLSIPEYEELKNSDPENAAMRVHDEANDVARLVMAKAIANKLDVAYDATTSGDSNTDMVRSLVKNGYDVHLNFVDIPVSEAIQRARLRAETSSDPSNKGRFVPDETIKATHYGAAQKFFELQKVPGVVSSKMYDNTGRSPILIYENHSNGETVHNPERFEQYKLKARGEHE